MNTKRKIRKLYKWLIGLNILAVPTSIYLTYLHYKPAGGEGSFCNISEKFNCDIVNKSIYSELFGIPVAILGGIAYMLLLIFSIRGLFKDQSKLIPLVYFCVIGATVFTLYLTGIEIFVLKAFCLFCLTLQVIILTQLGIFTYLFRHNR